MNTLDKEDKPKPTTDEEQIVGQHQKQRIRIHDGLMGNLSDLIMNSSCQDCNAKLEWDAVFHENNEVFTAVHCSKLYSIAGITAGVRVIEVSDEDARKQVEKQQSKRHEEEVKKQEEESKKQNDKDLAEIQKQGLNTDREGGQADALNAQKDAQTVATHAEDPTTRKQANTIAKKLDQQTTDDKTEVKK